jgi:osmotically-inducible protein OsmY
LPDKDAVKETHFYPMGRRDNFQDSDRMSDHPSSQPNGDGRTYNGDAQNDRMSQDRDWYERNERRRGARADHRAQREYRQDYGSNVNYGERYGFSGYGRAHYDPDINRGWQEDHDVQSWRADQPFNDREQDYRGGRWNRETRSYESGGQRRGYYGSWNPDNQRSSNQQQYFGVGPKNYKRSDERIQEEVCELLTYHSGIDASNIDVKVSGGEVTLTGEIPDRYMKRMAEDVIDEIPGVKNVNNQLRVEQSNRGYMTGSNGSNGMGTGQQLPS